MNDLQRYAAPGARFHEEWVRVNEQVELRVIHFTPEQDDGAVPLVLVPGLSTIIESFKDILLELTKDFRVHYIETREKSTSRISGKVSYDMEALGEDVIAVIHYLQLQEDGYALLGYSLGATAVLDCYKRLPARPAMLLLMEPTPVFHYPRWALHTIRLLAVPVYPVLKPFAKWYLRTFTIDTKEDQELALISSRALDNADPRKLKNCILAIASYQVWPRLPEVDCPSLIIATSKDRFHVHEEINRMARTLRHCGIIDMENNKRTHDKEMGEVVRAYVESVRDLVPGADLPDHKYVFTINEYAHEPQS